MAYLDSSGVQYLWGKIKALIPSTYVTSVNGSTGAVTVAVPTAVSDLTNDSGFQTASQVQTAIQNYVNSLDATEVSY